MMTSKICRIKCHFLLRTIEHGDRQNKQDSAESHLSDTVLLHWPRIQKNIRQQGKSYIYLLLTMISKRNLKLKNNSNKLKCLLERWKIVCIRYGLVSSATAADWLVNCTFTP